MDEGSWVGLDVRARSVVASVLDGGAVCCARGGCRSLRLTIRCRVDRQLRKAIKTKGSFPSENAARKLVYLAIQNAGSQ